MLAAGCDQRLRAGGMVTDPDPDADGARRRNRSAGEGDVAVRRFRRVVVPAGRPRRVALDRVLAGPVRVHLPDLVRADVGIGGVVLVEQDVLPVGRPTRGRVLDSEDLVVRGQLYGTRTVRVGDPQDFIVAGARAGNSRPVEDDLCPIRRIGRHGEAVGQLQPATGQRERRIARTVRIHRVDHRWQSVVRGGERDHAVGGARHGPRGRRLAGRCVGNRCRDTADCDGCYEAQQ